MHEDEQKILDLIVEETSAYLERDFDRWKQCWLQDASARRLCALIGGIMDYTQGWEAGFELVAKILEKYPEPNPEAAKSIKRSNVNIRIGGDMAWASYDQYGERCDDPLVIVGLSHQVRVFERVDGDWKIAMAGHGDSGLEYFDFPVIKITKDHKITWMNDQAEQELPSHPILMKSGAFLKAQLKHDQQSLSSAIERARDTITIERRPSVLNPQGRPADPIILTGDGTISRHIVWITTYDGSLLISFRDIKNEHARLSQATELFNLSTAQAKLARHIIEGHDLSKIAQLLTISVNTAKTHLSRMFDKTDTHSQAELVAKLLDIAPPK